MELNDRRHHHVVRCSQAVVWIDHHTARIIELSRDDRHVVDVEPRFPSRRVHRMDGVTGSGHHPADRRYLDDVVNSLEGIDEVLIAGPGTAKVRLEHHLARRRPDVACHVVAVHAVESPSDGPLAALVRQELARIGQPR